MSSRQAQGNRRCSAPVRVPVQRTLSLTLPATARQGSTVRKATYRQIQASVKETAGFVPKRDWIAHVKELNGLPLKHTQKSHTKRLEPCPPAKRKAIEDALRKFGFLAQRT